MSVSLARTARVAPTLALAGLVLVAATPLLPHVEFVWGLSLDDLLPIAGALLMTPLAVSSPGVPLPATTRAIAAALAGLAVLGYLSSVATAPSGVVGLHMILRSVIRPAVLGWIAFCAWRSSSLPHARQLFAGSVAAIGTIEALFGIAAIVVGLPGGIGLETTRRNSVLSGVIAGRVNGTLGLSPDFLGAVFLFTLPFALAFVLRPAPLATRLMWLGAVGLQLVALTLTLTRASAGIGFVEVLVLAALSGRRAAALATLGTVAVLAIATPLGMRFLSEGNDRLALWSSAVRVAADHPLLGVGPGRMLEVAAADPARYQVTSFGTATNSAHNSVLLAAAELGLFGGLATAMIVLALIVRGVRAVLAAFVARTDVLDAAAGVALLGFVTQSMVNNLFTVAVTATYAAAVFGVFLARGDSEGVVVVPA